MVADSRGTVPRTRDLILREAARLFASRGYLGVSIADIGAAAGISGPAIYRHFEGKDALLATILIDVSERLLAGARRELERAPGPEDALRALIDFQVSFALDQPELITLQDRELHILDVEDRRTVRRLQRGYVEVWVDQIERLTPGIAPERARATTHAVFGLINSTPHSAARRSLGRSEMAELLGRMARSAVLSGADSPVAER